MAGALSRPAVRPDFGAMVLRGTEASRSPSLLSLAFAARSFPLLNPNSTHQNEYKHTTQERKRANQTGTREHNALHCGAVATHTTHTHTHTCPPEFLIATATRAKLHVSIAVQIDVESRVYVFTQAPITYNSNLLLLWNCVNHTAHELCRAKRHDEGIEPQAALMQLWASPRLTWHACVRRACDVVRVRVRASARARAVLTQDVNLTALFTWLRHVRLLTTRLVRSATGLLHCALL